MTKKTRRNKKTHYKLKKAARFQRNALAVLIMLTLLMFIGIWLFVVSARGNKDDVVKTDSINRSNSSQLDKNSKKETIKKESRQLYVDAESSAALALKNSKNTTTIKKLSVLAKTPTGIWQTSGSDLSVFTAKMEKARSVSKSPIVVLYAIPNIGCGSGGLANESSYIKWVAQRAKAIDGTKAIVVVEPDAVSMFNCLSGSQLEVRKKSLNGAINELSKTDARIYIDAGHSEWVSPVDTVKRLQMLDMSKTDGISVNVSNYQTNADSKEFATNVLDQLAVPQLNAVVDTSRNGNGPPAGNEWCNPLGRRVGTSSVMKQDGRVAGYLWIKVPGESDGSGSTCSNGTREGSFWLEYAIGLVS